jgi:hypothetical protein
VITTIAIDDLYAAKGQKIEAFDTVFIWWDGQWYELHLTQGNIAQLGKDLGKYLDVARKSKGPKAAQPPAPRHAAKPGKRGPSKGPKRDWTGFRAWCDAQEPRRTYMSGGGFYAKVQDQKDYEQWLADQRETAREGKPGDPDARWRPSAQVA